MHFVGSCDYHLFSRSLPSFIFAKTVFWEWLKEFLFGICLLCELFDEVTMRLQNSFFLAETQELALS